MHFSLPSIKCSRAPPVSGYCRARGNQIAEHSSDKETVLDSSRKLRGAAEHLIDGSVKHICRLSFTERRSNKLAYPLRGSISGRQKLEGFVWGRKHFALQ